MFKSIVEMYPDMLDSEFVENFDFDACWTKTNEDGSYDDKDVALAIARTNCNLTAAAKLLGRSRRSLSNYIARSPSLTEYFEDVQDEFVDAVESLHKNAALMGDLATQKFFLTTKGKDRGYSTRSEITGKDGVPLAPEIRPDMSLEEAERAYKDSL